MKINFSVKIGALLVGAAVALAPLFTTLPAGAQNANAGRGAATSKRGEPRGDDRALQRLSEVLNLTPAQQTRIAPILRSSSQQARAIHNNKKLTREQKRVRFASLQVSVTNRINVHLNTEQRRKLASMLQQFKQRRPAMRR